MDFSSNSKSNENYESLVSTLTNLDKIVSNILFLNKEIKNYSNKKDEIRNYQKDISNTLNSNLSYFNYRFDSVESNGLFFALNRKQIVALSEKGIFILILINFFCRI